MAISELDVIGIAEGTDKCLLRQDYLRHYERCFGHLRESAFTLVEVGVLDGGSLRMWRRFLPRATIVGVDINSAAKRHEGDGIRVEIGSQTDPGFVAELCTR